ncbi:MAG: hypothetical protein ACYDC8_14190 [Gammaproteobacteria bacterium]
MTRAIGRGQAAANQTTFEKKTVTAMLHRLRKLRYTLGRALLGAFVLAWAMAAIAPCLMAPALAQGVSGTTPKTHTCCLPGESAAQTPAPHCSVFGCDAQSSVQPTFDLQLLLRVLQLTSFAVLLYLVLMTTWRAALHAPAVSLFPSPPRPHPTLAYCTLLI